MKVLFYNSTVFFFIQIFCHLLYFWCIETSKCTSLHVVFICGGVILQIVSVDFSTSGGKARPRKTTKPVPGKGKKKEKKADK